MVTAHEAFKSAGGTSGLIEKYDDSGDTTTASNSTDSDTSNSSSTSATQEETEPSTSSDSGLLNETEAEELAESTANTSGYDKFKNRAEDDDIPTPDPTGTTTDMRETVKVETEDDEVKYAPEESDSSGQQDYRVTGMGDGTQSDPNNDPVDVGSSGDGVKWDNTTPLEGSDDNGQQSGGTMLSGGSDSFGGIGLAAIGAAVLGAVALASKGGIR